MFLDVNAGAGEGDKGRLAQKPHNISVSLSDTIPIANSAK